MGETRSPTLCVFAAMRVYSQHALCIALFATVGAAANLKKGAKDLIVLTDSNFEHDTQASTGMTTGPWFVKFFAPWCGHCKSMAPAWEEVATQLKGQVNVAEVDCTLHHDLRERFEIKSFPRSNT